MKKIILFDIDGTLFDVPVFLRLFHEKLVERFGLSEQDISELQVLYEEVKKENGYFLPASFLDKIVNHFPSVDKKNLEEIFWNIDLFEKSMYKDTSIIKGLADSAVIGIFSKGEEKFQKKKITFLNDFVNNSDVYIFPDKIDNISQVFDKYESYKIFLVDDILEVLTKAKNLYPEMTGVLIDRSGQFSQSEDVIKINDLNELKSII